MLRKIARALGYSLQKLRRADAEEDIHYMAFKLTKPTLILDCGANQGAFYKACRNVGYKGKIWCFEPNVKCVENLNAMASSDGNMRVFPLGTGDADSTTTLQVAGEDGNMGSLLPQQPWMTDRFKSAWVRDQYEVNVRRLDRVLDEERVPEDERIFMKIDTQGFDRATFLGMGGRIAQVIGIKAEFSVQTIYQGAPLHWEMLDVLRKYGFEPFWFSTVSRGFDGRIIEYDAYFVKVDEKVN